MLVLAFGLAFAGYVLFVSINKEKAEPIVANPLPQSLVYKDLVKVESPLVNTKISSPVVVKGEARGYWYFEASFPVEVVDLAGNILGKGIAQAKGDWMTENFVPFEATITFAPPAPLTQGKIILRKDNPSGLPEHDDSLEIPIVFE